MKKLILVFFILFSPAMSWADLFEMEEKPEVSPRKAILVLKEDFEKKECRFRNAKAFIVGNFDPSYYFRFQVSPDCMDSFLKKYSLIAKKSDQQLNFILLNQIRSSWWKPGELEDYVYYETSKKHTDNNLYFLMYDVTTETAYLYLQDF